jgi:P-type Cu+ transporter
MVMEGRCDTMTTTASDPVCGMRIDEAESWGVARFEGRVFHFCSELCKSRFDADPERYAVGTGVPEPRP